MAVGILCEECQSLNEETAFSHDEIQHCLLHHHDLDKKLLFRAGGLGTTLRFPSATPMDLTLTDEERKQRVSELDMPTFGPDRIIHSSLIGMDYVPPIPVIVRKFHPQNGDRLSKRWVDATGRRKSVELPYYAIANVHQYADQFIDYLRNNYMDWAQNPRSGEAYTAIATLIQKFETSPADRELYQRLLFFIFAALHKTQTAYIAGDGETLNTPVIHEQGHRLDGKRIVPRMILAQVDPLNTLHVLIPSQKDLLQRLTALFDSGDPQNWGPCITSLAALCSMGAEMFADRRRHGQENGVKGRYSVPEFVAEAGETLMLLIAKFHDYERRCGRETGLQKCDSLIKDYFYQISNLKKAGDDEIEAPAWWLEQLVADPKRWDPRSIPYEA